MQNYLLLIIIMTFFSCNKKEENVTIIHSTHSKINISIDNLYGAREIIKAGKDKLVIGVNTSADTVYYLINLKNKRIYPFGIKGRGPGEILSKSSPIYRKETNNFCFLDPMKREYYSYSLNSIIKGNKLYKEKVFTSEEIDKGTILNCIPFCDSLFISTGLYQKGRFGLYNSVGQLAFTFGLFPINSETTKRLSNQQLGLAYQSILRSHPNKPLFVSVLRYSDLLEIYEFINNDFICLNKNYVPKHPPCVKLIKMGNRWTTIKCKNSMRAFQDCSVSDKYIFISFSPDKFKPSSTNRSKKPKSIRVYNWKGDYIANIKTDLPIWDFTVERIGNKHIFYAIAQNDSDTSPWILVKYEVEI